jgi:hypothetical protein
MVMQKESINDIFYMYREFFERSIVDGVSQTNCHLLILNGHGSHVTLKAIEQAQIFGLYTVTLHSHSSHVFQPLDISCFKPFKTTFKKKRDEVMVKNNHFETNTVMVVSWVDLALEFILSRNNIQSMYTITSIWLLNVKAMDEKIIPSEAFTKNNTTKVKDEKVYDEEANDEDT